MENIERRVRREVRAMTTAGSDHQGNHSRQLNWVQAADILAIPRDTCGASSGRSNEARHLLWR